MNIAQINFFVDEVAIEIVWLHTIKESQCYHQSTFYCFIKIAFLTSEISSS